MSNNLLCHGITWFNNAAVWVFFAQGTSSGLPFEKRAIALWRRMGRNEVKVVLAPPTLQLVPGSIQPVKIDSSLGTYLFRKTYLKCQLALRNNAECQPDGVMSFTWAQFFFCGKRYELLSNNYMSKSKVVRQWRTREFSKVGIYSALLWGGACLLMGGGRHKLATYWYGAFCM